MKKLIALLLALIMVFALVACSNSEEKDESKDSNSDLAGTYDITMWVSEMDGVAEMTQEMIDAFEEANPGIKINASIEGVTEADAGSKVVADVATAPDIYCFAQDQLARLVQAAALAQPGKGAVETIKANNDAGSVAAASVAGTVYAYPMTSDNGYYMYYNKALISDEDAESMEKIIAICEQNNLKFRYALENAWYTASFFFATGCHSTWTMNEAGEYVALDDDFNSAAGMAAMKGMQKLAQSPCYDSNADIFTDAAVVITGIWAANDAAAHFGDNLGATDLPSFEVDGKSYHLGSYTGNKLMGVKPQTDPKKAAVLSLLAQWLTNEECQVQRYEQFQWGPSNKAAQSSDAVKTNLSLVALAKQNEYGIPQGQIHGSWWDTAKVLGAEAKAATSDADLQSALDDYDAANDSALSMTDEAKNAWTVIGSVGGTMWDVDFTMTEDPAGTWTSVPIEMQAGNEFKIRQGLAWDNQVGADNVMKTPEVEPANIVVEADGTYKVVFVWDGALGAQVTLVPVE